MRPNVKELKSLYPAKPAGAKKRPHVKELKRHALGISGLNYAEKQRIMPVYPHNKGVSARLGATQGKSTQNVIVALMLVDFAVSVHADFGFFAALRKALSIL